MISQDRGPYSMPHGHDVKHTFVALALCDLFGVDNQEFRISTLFMRKTKLSLISRFNFYSPGHFTPEPVRAVLISISAEQTKRRHSPTAIPSCDPKVPWPVGTCHPCRKCPLPCNFPASRAALRNPKSKRHPLFENADVGHRNFPSFPRVRAHRLDEPGHPS